MEYKFLLLIFLSGVAVGMATAITIALRATNCRDAHLCNNSSSGFDNRQGEDGEQ